MRICNQLFIIILLVSCSVVSTAQTVFRGTVIDATTKQPIVNARVGINNQGVGEITNGKGFFNYRKYHEVVNSESQLVVGAAGYESLQLDATQVRQLFNRSSKIELQPSSKQKETKKVNNNLTIFWDVSEDMQGRDVEAEIAYVQEYVSKYKDLTIRFVAFDYKVRTDERIVVRGSDISRFRESVKALIYNGPSNYDVLDITGADAVILSSNGNPNYGTLNVSQDIPVYAIASEAIEVNEKYMQLLGQYTQGVYRPIKSYDGNTVQSTSVTQVLEGATIKGTITSLGKPLQEVSIIKKGDLTEYLTKADGSFEVPAKEGDILQFRYLGMFPKDVLISDKKILTIELLPNSDVLDEVVIEKKIEKIIVGDKEIRGRKVSPYIPGGVTGALDRYITADDITPNAKTLAYVIRDNFKRARIVFTSQGERILIKEQSPSFYINGAEVQNIDQALAILDKDIESIIIKDSPVTTSRYGPIIPGLAVIITTKSVDLSKKKRVNSTLVKGNDYTEEVATIKEGVIVSSLKQIKGKVTSLGKPIQGATINKKGTFEEYTSKSDGSFTLPAKEGDQLVVYYLGMYPKGFFVNDKTAYTIDLIPKSDVLDEVVLKGNERKENIVKTASGDKNFDSIGYDLKFVKGEDIPETALDLASFLNGRFAGINASSNGIGTPLVIINSRAKLTSNGDMLIDMDGQLAAPGESVSVLDIAPSRIESISVIKGLAGSTLYGTLGRNGVVIIRTKALSGNNVAEKVPSLLVKGNEYTEEIQSISDDMVSGKSQITGIITSLGKPIQGATISKKGTFEEYTSESDGSFKVFASEGDVLVVSYLGMYPKVILVENKSSYIIDLTPKNDVLDEVVLKVEEKSEREKLLEKKDDLRRKSGFSTNFILREEFEDRGYLSAVSLIVGKLAGTRQIGVYPYRTILNTRSGGAYAVAVDGIEREHEFLETIPLGIIAYIEITKSPSAGIKYGFSTPSGLISITTRNFENINAEKKEILSLLVEGNDYAGEEVKTLETNPVTSPSKLAITGIVKDLNGFLADATITRKGSFDEVFTDTQGRFEIKAALGDVLVVSKAGMFTKEVLVESQNVGIIALTPKNDNLDEVIVSGDKRVDNTIERSDGKRVNKDKLGYAAQELTENDFADGATNLQQLITGKVSGVTVEGGLYSGSQVVYKIRGGNMSITNEIPPIWIVNGIPYPDPPDFLDVQQIASITVLKSASATSRYGTLAAGGAFLIKTKEVSFQDKAKKAQKSALVSGNEYTESTTGNIDTSTLPSYILRLREIPNLQEQFELYQRISRTQESPLEFYVDVAQYFDGINKEMADQVRADLAYISRNNTKALRTLCYIYEAAGDYEKAALIYERILKLAPSEAQSYRDLALIYQEIGKYNEALELYYNMLGEQIKGVNFQGLEKSIKNELSHLLALYKDQVDYERFPNEWLRTDFDIDIRMVIDWSDRSVPFEFQFVNPDKKFFKWTHTLEETRDRLEEEQAQGYQSEEFIIDDAPPGEWLINIQYLGDEGDYVLPPFMKYTVYKNYGTPQQTKEIKVVKLFKQSDKVTLGKVVL